MKIIPLTWLIQLLCFAHNLKLTFSHYTAATVWISQFCLALKPRSEFCLLTRRWRQIHQIACFLSTLARSGRLQDPVYGHGWQPPLLCCLVLRALRSLQDKVSASQHAFPLVSSTYKIVLDTVERQREYKKTCRAV